MELGKSLAEARRKSGLSQEAVAESLGVSRQTVSKWEIGQVVPNIAQCQKLAALYRLSLDELVPGDLLFWGSGSGVYHVGIYAGDGEYIHASTGGGRVMRATFDYFAPDFAKRVIE